MKYSVLKKVGDAVIAKTPIEVADNGGFSHLALSPLLCHLGSNYRSPFRKMQVKQQIGHLQYIALYYRVIDLLT